MSEPSTTSPLAEASEHSLDEFFSRRPPFDGETLRVMIAEFRRMRVKWQSGEAERAAKPKRAAKSVAKPSAIPLTQGDLWAENPDDVPGSEGATT